MENSWAFSLFAILLFAVGSEGQLAPSETRILFQVQKLLEYPQLLQGWTNWTNFCYLPFSPSLNIICSNNRVIQLKIVGNKTSPASQTHKPKFSISNQTLSDKFDIDAFFTVLTKLSRLKVLSLVSLGLWGALPAKINRFESLQLLNISSNFIHGEIPYEITTMTTLTSLVLADNLLNGSVPDLKGLSILQDLNLGFNHLGPEFPSMTTNVVSITLNDNSFRSEIPLSLKNFKQLQQLDISANNLIGPIPSFLFSLPSLVFLNVAQNQFSGALSMNLTCNAELEFVDISHNLLIGKLPSCIGSKFSNRTVVSTWNCLSIANSKYQHPYSVCHKEALAVKPPIKTDMKRQSKVKLGLLIGIIGAVVVIAGVVGFLILVFIRRSHRTNGDEYKVERFIPQTPVSSFPKSMIINSRRVPQTMRSAAIGLPPYRVFTLEEMEQATNNFDPSNFLGEEYQGQLYKGSLRDGSIVLVKYLKLKQRNLHQSLMQQMEVLSKLRHQHLVSVLGHCLVTYQEHPNSGGNTIFVVHEHISNGSLRDYLTDGRKKEILKWPQRMGIIIGAVRGIQFLHTGVSSGIFGNNLKLDNILLDETLTAKLSNYNIPLPSKVGSESPLHGREISNHPSSPRRAEKEDVYQLGIILLEVITGEPVNSPRQLDEVKLQLQKALVEAPSKLRGVVDSSMKGTFAYESLRTTVDIAINCLSKEPGLRPSIEDILWNLQYSFQVQEGWTSSGNLSTQM
ncbi:LRR receptor-like serine/threonine-protein kinase [Tripterygium wilfordii]|uniref:non-specific serine/threonine protein kinase n=1 Tax=Tripterygium wilfordii TaxID=458696 RepID=A0A7J7D3T0_TRIWF|nr:probable LRR receptor-like serine/threonine-protein kinase At1g14390 [Tripterygium wilfordii]KAF5741007.1 LRR receptor-like serine/threonine-protein kinase [Tripterygium wilfordii]